MSQGQEVRAGQVYEDVKERTGRRIEVLSVDLQQKTVGRFKARYTYARCQVSGGKAPYTGKPTAVKVVRIDTDRLRSYEYKLVFNPCPVTAEGTQDACSVGPVA